MPNYAIWACNDDYTRHVALTNTPQARTWSRLTYRQAINDLESATLDLVPSSAKIPEIALMQRLLVYRDGVLVFGGLIEREEWSIGPSAKEDTYAISARSAAEYATWRLAVPASGQPQDKRTGHLDDVAKAYVRAHMGALADVARQFSDLAVQADAGAAASDTWEARYDELLKLLQAIGTAGGFDWRFVPSATGWEFQTAYPRWGLDRSKGNGVNDEMVFSPDRRNFLEMSYTADLLGHCNYVYTGGQGEEETRPIVPVSDATAVTAYKRRETFYNASRYTLESSLTAQGNIQLAKLAPSETMTVVPKSGVWPGSFGLGDTVTCFANVYSRTFQADLKVPAINVEVTPDGVESVRPELEAV